MVNTRPKVATASEKTCSRPLRSLIDTCNNDLLEHRVGKQHTDHGAGNLGSDIGQRASAAGLTLQHETR